MSEQQLSAFNDTWNYYFGRDMVPAFGGLDYRNKLSLYVIACCNLANKSGIPNPFHYVL